MDMEQLKTLFQILASFAKIAKASKDMYSYNKEPDHTPVSDEFRNAVTGSADPASIPPPSGNFVNFLNQIPDVVLDPLRERVEDHYKDYQIILRDPGSTGFVIKRAEQIIGSDVCSLLRFIQKYNGGRLPEGTVYTDLWNLFGCGTLGTVI